MSKFNEALNYVIGELQKVLPAGYSVSIAVDSDEADLSVYDGEYDILEVYPNHDCKLSDIVDAIKESVE